MRRWLVALCAVVAASCGALSASVETTGALEQAKEPTVLAAEPVALDEMPALWPPSPPVPRSEAERAWDSLRRKENCMCALLEGDEEWRSFLEGIDHEAFVLLLSRLDSKTPSGTAGCCTRGGRLTEGELALYAIEVSLSRRSGRWTSGLDLLDREELHALRSEEAVRSVLEDSALKDELKRRLFHLYAAVSNLRPEAERQLAQAVFGKGEGQ